MATRTIVVAGNGTNQLSYQLDGPDETGVFAVLAEIDAGGAGDTTATLLATSPAGSDVAAVPQGQAVSGGGQGRATWALRLAEDSVSAPAVPLVTTDGVHVVNPTHELLFDPPASVTDLGGGIARIDITPVTPALIYAQAIVPGGAWPLVEFPLPLSAGPSHGVTVGATSWTIQTAGVYQLVLFGNMLHGGPEPADAAMGMYWDISGVVSGSGWQLPVAIGALNTWQVGPTLVEQHTLAVGNVIRFGVGHQGNAPVGLGMTMSLVRLGA